MKNLICTATAPGAFTEGKQYPVVSEDSGAFTLIDDGGRQHFVRKGLDFQQAHFAGADND